MKRDSGLDFAVLEQFIHERKAKIDLKYRSSSFFS